MSRWHLQVCEREFVEWWYGPLHPSARGHLDVAVTYIGGKIPLELPFTLPEHRPEGSLKPPQEIRRVHSWGWRIRTNDYIHDGGWHLAESKDACITDCLAMALDRGVGERDVYDDAVKDVREYRTGLW